MPLGDILAARADNARARGTVTLDALGTVALEALPPRELERLSRGADGDRAVFYAACRELQGVGAALLRAGKVYRPDEVTALVSDAEAAKAAEAVRALSGWTVCAGETGEKAADALPAERTVRGSAGADADADTGAEHSDRDTDKAAPVGAASPAKAEGTETDKRTLGQVSRETEVRPEGVQMAEKVRPDAVQENAEVRHSAVQENGGADEVRHGGVQENVTAFEEIRQDFVQNRRTGGQASCEFLTQNGETARPRGETQVLPEKMPDAPLNVGVSDNSDDGLRKTAEAFGSKNVETERGAERDLHEMKTEFAGTMHESKSEIAPRGGAGLHEMRSEIVSRNVEGLHESKSEFAPRSGAGLHETESEIVSRNVEGLHETESELAERVARELIDGLRRASWVR